MMPYKGKTPSRIGFALPPIFLAAYLAGFPLPVPAFLVPARTYLLIPADGASLSFQDAKIPRRNVFLVLSDKVVPLPGERGSDLAGILPARPSVRTALKDAEHSSRRFRKLRILCGTVPSAEEIQAARSFQERTGRPVSLIVLPDETPLLRALSYRPTPGDASLAATVLTGPGASGYHGLYASQDSFALGSWPVSDLSPAGFRIPVSAGSSPLTLAFSGVSGTLRREILLATPDSGEPRVLVVSSRPERRNVLDAFYTTRRMSPADLSGADLASWPLIAFDGVPLKEIPSEASRVLKDLVERRAVSLFFAADSPSFGREGDNPYLEPLLPVDLLPRSLKRLPDLAVLVLLDVSGSMFGDKLSLAKAAGVELLKALKPSDLVGILLFSEQRHWLYRFERNETIVPTRDIPSLSAGGGTDLASALREGLAGLEAHGQRDMHTVIVSDGVTKGADFRTLEDQAKRAGISISTIAVGNDADFALLERLSRNTGGRAYRADRFDQIPSLLFEDRTRVSRTAFSRETQSILALNGEKVASVDGMALLTPRKAATVLFSNELGDPLLALREYRNRSVLVFASDLYGGYTADFFRSPRAVAQMKRRLDTLLAEERVAVSITEHGGGVEVVLQSPWLVSPSLRALSRQAGSAWEGEFRKTAPGVFSLAIPLSERGTYTAMLSDRGAVFARFPLAMNGFFRSVPVSGFAAAREYRTRFFLLYGNGGIWLIAFFLSSLVVTVLRRMDFSERPT